MRRSSLSFIATFVCGAVALAQPTGPTFDVVAIRQLDPDRDPWLVPQDFSPVSPGAYSNPSTSLISLVSFAYNIKLPGLYLTGLPKWTEKTGFSVDAKAGPDYKAGTAAENYEQVRLMVRQMLADRFQLKIHSETRSATLLDLELGRGGLLLPEVPAPILPEKEGNVGMALGDSGGRMIAKKSTMAGLATTLSVFFPQPVIDKTGLKGYYDFDIRWTAPDRTTASEGLGPDGLSLLITTLQDRLGLILKKTSGTMQVWVIDHVEMPSPN